MHGQDLTALKNAMDDGGDAHNIHKLIYNDILVCSVHCTHLLFQMTSPWSGTCLSDAHTQADETMVSCSNNNKRMCAVNGCHGIDLMQLSCVRL